MKAWNSFPMLRLVLPFLMGVVAFSFFLEEEGIDPVFIFYGMISIVALVILLIMMHKRGRTPHLFGIVLMPLLFLTGGLLSVSVSDHVFPGHLDENRLTGTQTFLARVSDQPQVKGGSIKLVADLTDLGHTMNGKVLLYFKMDSLPPDLKLGEEILISTQLQRVKGAGNPNEFNYARYLRFHGVLFRGSVELGNWRKLSDGRPGIMGWFAELRSRMIGKFKDAGLEGNELSVASALILGHRAELDRELMAAYAGSGATHVLAVSGLHVGIVYLILNTLLRFMEKYKHGSILKTVLLIFLLLSYAALTGLSASVSRAAVMFVFVAVGKAIDRDTNIFNTLAASAFFLVAYEPMMIMQVGFQLSYLAVIGIVVIYPLLLDLRSFENRWADRVWSITCVSMAAQIATFPLGLLYFHQFPNLFLLSNLVVIPAATAILYLGFALFVFSFWNPTLLFFGFILKWVIRILNQVVVWIEQIPHSVLSGIDISTLETLLVYAVILGLLIFIIQQQRFGLYLGLGVAILFMFFQVQEVYEQKTQQFMTVYNVKGHTAIALVNGNEVTFISRRELWENEQSMLFHIRHHWWRKGIEQENFVELNESQMNRRLTWGKKSFAIVNLKDQERRDLLIDGADDIDLIIADGVDWKSCGYLSEFNGTLLVSDRFGTKTTGRIKELNPRSQFISEMGATTY